MMPSYVFDWVHEVAIAELQAFWEAVERRESPRLAIFMPPRVGKSQLSSIFLPSWGLGRSPKKEVVVTAYAANLADEFSKKTRELLRDPDYWLIFPNTKLHKEMAAVDSWRTTDMGGYASVGVGGGLTGKGADLLILDDLYKDRQDADSESYRKMVEEWFRSTAYTRIQPGGGCLVLFTRWHEADLGGIIEDTMQHEGFKILRFAAIAEHDEPPYRLAGESINPLRRSAEDYLRIKRTVGMREWQCLYQQDPVPADGTMFKLSDVRYYDKDIEEDMPDLKRLPDREDLTYYSAWDFSTGRGTDFTVGGVAAIDRDYNLYLIDIKRGKWSSFDIAEKIIDTAIEHKTQRNGMEQGQLSAMIEPILNKRMQEKQKFINVTPLKPGRQNKVARSMTIHARMQQGKVFLPKNAPWLQDFLAELMKFPNGRNDDQCLIAGTLVETIHGGVPIEQVAVGDIVVTPVGNKRVVNSGCTSELATVYRVLLSNGAELVGTGNHPVMTTDGWMTIDALTYGRCVVILNTYNSRSKYTWTEKQRSTTVSSGIDTLSLNRKHTDGISKNTVTRTEVLPTYIDTYGRSITDLYQKVISFTTRIATLLTTRWRTSSALLSDSTSANIRTNEARSRHQNSTSHTSLQSGNLLKNGTHPRRGVSGTATMRKTLGLVEHQLLNSASAAVKTSTPSYLPEQTTAEAHATLDTGEVLTSLRQLSTLPVPSAGQVSQQPNVHSVTAPSLAAPEETTATVMLKEKLPTQQAVFNLTVEEAHVYYANGVLTHNCDTFAYLGLMINDVSAPVKKAPPKKKGWMDRLQKQIGGGDSWMSA
jgi:predicted phage terminase large subunit-like protein